MRIRNKKGFSIIELLIAIVILSMAVGTLVVVLDEVIHAEVLPETLNISTALAEQEMERVTALRFASVVNEGPIAYTGDFSSYTYEIKVTAVPVDLANDPGMSNYKQVQIIVQHSVLGSVNLETIVTNH